MTAPGALAVLARVRSRRLAASLGNAERCDLCAARLAGEHPHVVDVARRQLRCACRPCWLLFDREEAHQPVRAVPEGVSALPPVSEGVWDGLGLPVGTAFLVRRDDGGVAAVCPSPAGATEGQPTDEGWQALLAALPELARLRPEVEGVLLHRSGGRSEAFLAPVDRCYALTGLLRAGWRGPDGGPEVRHALEGFLADLRGRAGAHP